MIAMTAPRSTPSPNLFNLSVSPSSFFSPPTVRKRRAASPATPPSPTTTYAPSSPWSLDISPVPAKRRRPNLAYGFSILSIDPPAVASAGPSSLPSYAESEQAEALRKRVDDDDGDSIDDDAHLFTANDVTVEEVVSPHKHPRPLFGARWSDSSASTGDQSDTTFSLPTLKLRGTQQADEIEQPPGAMSSDYADDIGVEDVTSRGTKRRSSSVSDSGRWKKMKDEMDVEMTGDGDMQEILRDEDRVRRRSKWHEPEKDRIVYTSLSSSPSGSSASGRARSTSPPSQLSQPGNNGFTISPSMLTRLLAAQKETSIPLPFNLTRPQPERGLVLYRPLGIQAGMDHTRSTEDIVRQWQGGMSVDQADSGRFEVVDEDEDLQLDQDRPTKSYQSGADMDVDMAVDV